MAIRRAAVLSVIVLGLLYPIASDTNTTSLPKVFDQTEKAVSAADQPPIQASSNVALSFDRSDVITSPAPVVPAPVRKESAVKPAPVKPSVVKAPTVSTPTEAPAVAELVPETRTVYVGLQGGQDVVDLGNGPVLFPLGAGFPPYVAEHDFLGGWARFGSLQNGMKVTMTGLVTGTYTVGKMINVPKHGTTDELFAFGEMPKVMLQTCIPNTNRMLVVGLY